MQYASLDKVFSRIGKKYERKLMSKNEKKEEKRNLEKGIKIKKIYSVKDLEKIWDLMIKRKTCPWINNDSNNYILNLSTKQVKRHKIIRLCLLYMVIKKFFYYKNKNGELRK